jgi:hypothetical protein
MKRGCPVRNKNSDSDRLLLGYTSGTHNGRNTMLHNPICTINESSVIISETNYENFLNKNVDIKFSAHDAFLE